MKIVEKSVRRNQNNQLSAEERNKSNEMTRMVNLDEIKVFSRLRTGQVKKRMAT